jgi:glycerol-3-phosphate dehydrogenase
VSQEISGLAAGLGDPAGPSVAGVTVAGVVAGVAMGPAALGPAQRAADLRRLAREHFDVLVIGGGVTGAGVALDAASRGLSVALVEARDYAAGTSSRSSKLVHGGLRYLEQLNLRLVHEALVERGLLLGRLAPHLVRPQPFLLPLTRHWQRPYYGAGVLAYDVFALASPFGRGVPAHRHVSRRGVLSCFPGLRSSAVVGGIVYHDAQVDDARFVVALARTAAHYGAALAPSVRATALLRDGERVVGARVRDLEGRRSFEVRARAVVAATGVWSDDVGEMLAAGNPPGSPTAGLRVRASKGVHLLVPRSAIDGGPGLILRTPTSVLFVIPWGRHWIVGTTDTPWDLSRDHPAASARDIDYLLEQINGVLARPLARGDIQGVYAGLRPLLAGESDATSRLSREHAVVEPVPGLVLIAGGKYTTYRVMARDAVDAVVRYWPGVPASVTHQLPLLGARAYPGVWADRARLASASGLDGGRVERLLGRYGDQVGVLLDLVAARPDLAEPLPGAPEYIAAEVVYAATAEGALHLDDVLTRRTRISVETAHRGVTTAGRVAALIAPILGWDPHAIRREVEHYTARVSAERESQTMLDDLTADAARVGAPDVRGTAIAADRTP